MSVQQVTPDRRVVVGVDTCKYVHDAVAIDDLGTVLGSCDTELIGDRPRLRDSGARREPFEKLAFARPFRMYADHGDRPSRRAAVGSVVSSAPHADEGTISRYSGLGWWRSRRA